MSNNDPHIGNMLGGYLLEAFLGRGGMGAVYLAEHGTLQRKVAVKVIVPEDADAPRLRERFLREAQLVAAINHPHVVPVYGAGEDAAGTLYLAMRYISGGDLRTLLRRQGAMPLDRAVRLIAAIGAALHAGHHLGLVHRDVKPANVLLEPVEGQDDHPYLSDFGLSTLIGQRSALSSSAHMVGTLDYMAPEQIRGGDVDPRSDVYSLGCLLYECLTGTTPFSGTDVAVMLAHLDTAPPAPSRLRPEIPASVDAVVAQAMAKDVSQRHQTAAEMVEALRVAQRGVGPRRSGRWSPPRLIAIGLGVCAAVAGAGAVVIHSRGHGTPHVVPQVARPAGTLAYTTARGIVSSDADEGHAKMIIPGRRADFPVISPDGTSIAFVRSAGPFGETGKLFVANRDGSHARRLTFGSAHVGSEDGGLSSVAWSHDGRHLAFASSSAVHGVLPGVHRPTLDVVDRDGKNLQRIVVGCPDGILSQAAYTRCAKQNPIHPTCTYKAGLPSCSGFGIVSPSWSRDDRNLLFSARGPHDGAALWVVKVASGALHRIDDGLSPGIDQDNPSWSPDGRLIAFDGCTADGFCAIYTMTPAGTSLRRLPAGTSIARDPAWSPDGHFLAYVCQFNGINSLCIMHPSGTGRRVRVKGSPSEQPNEVNWSR